MGGLKTDQLKTVLLNPGPVSLSDGVRAAAVAQDLCHREPEYFDIQRAVIDGLLDVYGCNHEQWACVTLGGSGTAALEAMMASLLPADAQVLVLENGVYGERISKVADVHGIRHSAVGHPWGAALDLPAIEQALATGAYSHLGMVHHETTTGRLNALAEVLDLCARFGVQLLLDAVSSFGAETIDFNHPALLACAGTANKCLHGIPGLAFVVCQRSALAAQLPRRSLYLHLPDWYAKQQQASTPYTPPVNACLALHQALLELAEQGGWQARRSRYRHLAGRLSRHLATLGVQPWLPAGDCSCVLHSYRLPPGTAYEQVHDKLKDYGFIIYAGQGGLSDQLFRISTMGNINDNDVLRLEAALTAVFSMQASD